MQALRTLFVAAAVAATVPLATPSASASGGVVEFDGTTHVNCIGCGTTTGTATLQFLGVRSDGSQVNGTVNATYTLNTGAGCGVSSTAVGSMTGVLRMNFVITSVGGAFVITTTGDINGSGVGAGSWCGGSVAGVIVGN